MTREQQAQDVFYLTDRDIYAVSVRGSFLRFTPQPGWVEHDPEVIWETQYDVMQGAMNKLGVTSEDIAAIGITNQRETTVVWNRYTGEPIYNAIVWQCRRTAPVIESLKEHGMGDYIREKQGLCRMLIFQERRLNGFLTMLRVQGNRRSEANYCLERLIHGLYGN